MAWRQRCRRLDHYQLDVNLLSVAQARVLIEFMVLPRTFPWKLLVKATPPWFSKEQSRPWLSDGPPDFTTLKKRLAVTDGALGLQGATGTKLVIVKAGRAMRGEQGQ
jgi:hypothetical protein